MEMWITEIYIDVCTLLLHRILQNYARCQLIKSFIMALDTDCVDAFTQFENTITNNGIPEREEMCVTMVQKYLPWQFGDLLQFMSYLMGHG